MLSAVVEDDRCLLVRDVWGSGKTAEHGVAEALNVGRRDVHLHIDRSGEQRDRHGLLHGPDRIDELFDGLWRLRRKAHRHNCLDPSVQRTVVDRSVVAGDHTTLFEACLLYTSPSPRD